LDPVQLFERKYPSAERYASARDAGPCTGDRDRNVRGRGVALRRDHSRFIRRNQHPLGVSAAQPRNVLQVVGGYTSRITGRMSGRLAVCFTMSRFSSARIFSFITPQSVFSSWFEPSSVFDTTCRACSTNTAPPPSAMEKPRLTISGGLSIRPVWRLMAMI